MRVLGVDPGLRWTGWCVLYRDLTEKPAAAIYNRAASSTLHFDKRREIVCQTGTLRRKDEMTEEAWRDRVLDAVKWYGVAHSVGLIAVEDFTHRSWMRRRITTAPDMGKLVGSLCDNLRTSHHVPLIVVRAEDSKRGMDPVRPWFRNPHEHSAFCAAVLGRSRYIFEQKGAARV